MQQTELLYADGKYVLTKTDRNLHPEQYGFTYNRPVKNEWATLSPKIACKLRQLAPPALRAKLDECEALLKMNAQLSIAPESISGVHVECPQNHEYLKFQLAAVEYMLRNKSVLLADEMGLGKTIEVIGLLNTLTTLRDILVVCPASLKYNWRNELNTWLISPVTIQIVFGQQMLVNSQVTIINYDLLTKHQDELTSKVWQVVVGDESTAIKSQSAKRYKAFKKIEAEHKILATGTPMPNRPEELFTQLHWLDPECWPDYGKFIFRYCNASYGRWGLDVKGASNMEELNARLRETVMIRRYKRDVLSELPPKFRQVIEIPCDDPTIPATEMALFKDFRKIKARIRVLERTARKSRHEKDYEETIANLKNALGIRFQELAKARHDTAVYKIPTVIAHLSNALESGKVVLFCHHRDVARRILQEFKTQAVILGGESTLGERQMAVERFQNDPAVKLFVGSLRAAGMGITLTASHHVIFAELDWTPAVLSQAEDRLHRVGQKENILVQHLVLEDSVDAMMAKRLITKQKVIDKVIR